MLDWLRNWLTVPASPLVECVRSPYWPNLRKQHLMTSPACAVCGTQRNVVPHHIKPVHLYPELELDLSNLITLCEGPGVNCHLMFGHLNNWQAFNPKVVEDCLMWREKIRARYLVRFDKPY